jgi:endonuclease III
MEQLAEWVAEERLNADPKELAELVRELDIAATAADSLVECSQQIQEVVQRWTERHGICKANR